MAQSSETEGRQQIYTCIFHTISPLCYIRYAMFTLHYATFRYIRYAILPLSYNRYTRLDLKGNQRHPNR